MRSGSTKHESNRRNVRVHIATLTLEVAAMWAVLTRLEGRKNQLASKLKLYNAELCSFPRQYQRLQGDRAGGYGRHLAARISG
jgi:predicted Ser/Thr protein kinase